jgi:hypothetical protein
VNDDVPVVSVDSHEEEHDVAIRLIDRVQASVTPPRAGRLHGVANVFKTLRLR